MIAAALAACQPSGEQAGPGSADVGNGEPTLSAELCEADVLPVHEVQGTGFRSPLEGSEATVRGVVSHILDDQGLFIQEERPTTFAQVSHGIFVASASLAGSVPVGDLLTVTGQIQELGESEDTLTALGAIKEFANCGTGAEPPEFDARLPLTAQEREALEGMHVLLEQPLTVTAVRNISDGEIRVSALGLLRAPTEVALPGEAAAEHQRKNSNWSLKVHSSELRKLEPYTQIQAGALVHMLPGVMGHDGYELVLLANEAIHHVPLPVPKVEEPAQGVIRVASFNLYEYFNGDGQGGGFPGERGAETLQQFERQAASIAAAIKVIKPDVLGVMELENDGFGPDSAIEHLRQLATQTLRAEFVVATPETERVGPDVINVGLIYRSDRLDASGPAVLLEGNSFGDLNRVPLAQTLIDKASGEKFVMVVNHLKSKGYCPDSADNGDQGDGQACWNASRTEGARATVEWAMNLAREAGTDKVLLVGDFNAYRLEDPVRAIEESQLTELVAHHNQGIPQYSYIYRGAAGTLDYAFASEALTSASTGAYIWNINAAYPWADRPSEPFLRSSDHDPVIVDLLFNQSDTSD